VNARDGAIERPHAVFIHKRHRLLQPVLLLG
jgi:hypothetical protein